MDPTPRDYLANERTFLAYVRTALSFVAFGFVVARFALFAREFAFIEHLPEAKTSTVSTSLGVVMTLTGIAVAIFGGWRYAVQDRALKTARAGSMPVRSAAIIAAIVVAFGLIIAIDLLRLH